MNNFNEWALKISIAILAVIAPVKPLLLATIFLCVVDMITGMWAAKKRGQKITSYNMRRTPAKMLAYLSAILVAFVIETYMIPELPISKVVGTLVAVTEGKSFFENLNVITGIDFWSAILNKIQGKDLDLTAIVKAQDDKK